MTTKLKKRCLEEGDLVRMIPKNYSSTGVKVADQWAGLTALLISKEGRWWTIMVTHPDDQVASLIYAQEGDFILI